MDTPKHYDMRMRFEHVFANGVNVIALVDLDELRAGAPGIELSMDGNVAPTLRRGWENSIEKESRRIINLLDNAPSSGGGAHTFLARVATRTAMHWTVEQTYRWLRDYGDHCGRYMPDREINEAIAGGRRFAGVANNAKDNDESASLPRQSPLRWPEPDHGEIERICRLGPRLATLSAGSPSPPKDDAPRTEEIIDLLFGGGDPWLCCGVASYKFFTQRRERWRERLSDQSFIVPSAMLGKYGFTKNDEVSEPAQSAVGPRQYLVVEFDYCEKCRDGKQDTAFAPLIRKLAVPASRARAALLAHLSRFAPLAFVVHSGGKSLHGWFPCTGISEDELRTSWLAPVNSAPIRRRGAHPNSSACPTGPVRPRQTPRGSTSAFSTRRRSPMLKTASRWNTGNRPRESRPPPSNAGRPSKCQPAKRSPSLPAFWGFQ